MAHDIPEIEPEVLTAGDLATWKISADDYLPVDGWVLTYTLINSAGKISITGSDNGDGYHLVSVAAATTAAYTAGDYRWQAYVTKAATSERYTLRRGEMEIRADFAGESGGYDGRGDWQKIVEQMEAALVTLTTSNATVATLSFNGRSVTYRSAEELIKALSYARTRARQDEQLDKLRDGLPAGNRIQIRF